MFLRMAKTAAVLALFALPVQAATVFDSGVGYSDVDTGLVSDIDAGANGRQAAAAASVSQATTLTGMTWTGFYVPSDTPNGTENFTLEFYAGGGATPGALIGSVDLGAATRSVVGSVGGRDLYEYTLSFDFLIGAGSFFVSLFNDTSADTDDNWFWAADSGATASAFSNDLGSGNWIATAQTMDFTLYGTAMVPLPAGLPLLLAAIAGIGLVGRRKLRA